MYKHFLRVKSFFCLEIEAASGRHFVSRAHLHRATTN